MGCGAQPAWLAECCLGLGYRVAVSNVSKAAIALAPAYGLHCTALLSLRGAHRQEVGGVVPLVLAQACYAGAESFYNPMHKLG